MPPPKEVTYCDGDIRKVVLLEPSTPHIPKLGDKVTVEIEVLRDVAAKMKADGMPVPKPRPDAQKVLPTKTYFLTVGEGGDIPKGIHTILPTMASGEKCRVHLRPAMGYAEGHLPVGIKADDFLMCYVKLVHAECTYLWKLGEDEISFRCTHPGNAFIYPSVLGRVSLAFTCRIPPLPASKNVPENEIPENEIPESESPESGAKMTDVCLEGESGNVVFSATPENPYQFVIGDGDTLGVLDLTVRNIHPGATGLLTIGPNCGFLADGKFRQLPFFSPDLVDRGLVLEDFNFLDYDAPPDFTMDLEDILAPLQKFKEEGNVLFKIGNFKNALLRYEFVADSCWGRDGGYEGDFEELIINTSNNIIRCHIRLEQYSSAEKEIEKMVKVKPSATLYFLQAMVHRIRNRFDEAMDALKIAESKGLSKADVEIERKRITVSRNKWRRARAMLSEPTQSAKE